ncbi:MAG: class I poly(R)-hydroxyalkanoic acid synthase [Caulobacteraceae bacterium]|nr:class I poly(R)-hydroxyalkanoic acid synthase [Caulobacter sp.]
MADDPSALLAEPRDPPLNGPAPMASAPPAAAPRPASTATGTSATPGAQAWAGLNAWLTPDGREAMESLAANLAKASALAQGALTGFAAAQDPSAPASPDPLHAAQAFAAVGEALAAQPEALVRAQMDLQARFAALWSATARRMAGEASAPVVEPPPGDKRFKDPDWSDNPAFDAIKQSYLIASEWMNGLVAQAQGVDPMMKRRAQFATKVLTDAASPSNSLFTNPVALREMMATGGQSLVRGAEQFARDLARGGGDGLAIAQTQYDKFEVGVNVATAPGKVVFQNSLFQLIQFSPSTEEVYATPLLILPPWINKYYIMDLQPKNSLIRWLVGQGFTVFVASWVNPGPELSHYTLHDYMTEGAYTAIEQVMLQTGQPHVNTVGYCIAGTLLACTLAHMAKRGVPAVSSATFFAAQQDFAEAGDLLMFTSDEWMADLKARIEAGGGVLPSKAMADTFNLLRGNDLIWSFFVNNYLLGKEPAAFDLLFWNSDQTRMPERLHVNYLDDFYRMNRLAKGELEVGGERLDLSEVKTPVYVQSSREDHIAPMRSVYRGARLFGGPTTFTLAGSGHIAGVINPPAANKYQHWINPDLPPTVEDWLTGAEQRPGSWWPHWGAWLAERSGDKLPARDPASGPLPVIEDAPGSYVKVRSDVVAA